jgi:hypothetical protein
MLLVIPAKAGIQNPPSAGKPHAESLDSRLRGNDRVEMRAEVGASDAFFNSPPVRIFPWNRGVIVQMSNPLEAQPCVKTRQHCAFAAENCHKSFPYSQ